MMQCHKWFQFVPVYERMKHTMHSEYYVYTHQGGPSSSPTYFLQQSKIRWNCATASWSMLSGVGMILDHSRLKRNAFEPGGDMQKLVVKSMLSYHRHWGLQDNLVCHT